MHSKFCLWTVSRFIQAPTCIFHNNDVIMSAMASPITSLTVVYSAVWSCTYQSICQSSAALAFVRGIHRSPVNSPHKGAVTRKCFHLMTLSCALKYLMYDDTDESIFTWVRRNIDIHHIGALITMYWIHRLIYSWHANNKVFLHIDPGTVSSNSSKGSSGAKSVPLRQVSLWLTSPYALMICRTFGYESFLLWYQSMQKCVEQNR